MRSYFNSGSTYRHSSTYTTCDMKVLSICHVNSDYCKMKVQYINKSSGDLQYCASGVSGHTSTIEIKVKDIHNWTRL